MGFPTKLGEYPATGNPGVVARVGEIPDYVTDEVNVFMAEPGIVKTLVYKMKTILPDYKHGLAIGENGRNFVIKHFNYKIQTKNISNFH